MSKFADIERCYAEIVNPERITSARNYNKHLPKYAHDFPPPDELARLARAVADMEDQMPIASEEFLRRIGQSTGRKLQNSP